MNIFLKSLYNWYRQVIRNPRYGWLVVAASLVYLFSPLDLAPDVIPILGQIDDIVIITILATEVLNVISGRFSTPETVSEINSDDIEGEIIDVESVSID
jgi:uncharacterized membrane protein YkvA (DUF1232 family)